MYRSMDRWIGTEDDGGIGRAAVTTSLGSRKISNSLTLTTRIGPLPSSFMFPSQTYAPRPCSNQWVYRVGVGPTTSCTIPLSSPAQFNLHASALSRRRNPRHILFEDTHDDALERGARHCRLRWGPSRRADTEELERQPWKQTGNAHVFDAVRRS